MLACELFLFVMFVSGVQFRSKSCHLQKYPGAPAFVGSFNGRQGERSFFKPVDKSRLWVLINVDCRLYGRVGGNLKKGQCTKIERSGCSVLFSALSVTHFVEAST